MERVDGRSPLRVAGVVGLLALVALLVPGAASAAIETHTQRVGPVKVGGYEVKQSVLPAPHVKEDGFVTNMEVDVVDAEGKPVPISRLMLHHIVFANLSGRDSTCNTLLGFDDRPTGLFGERFYAAGEERAKMALPPGYGYKLGSDDFWGMLYMFMNHRAVSDSAYIQYTYRVATGEDAEGLKKVDPYWMDVENCRADPIYNVPGTKDEGEVQTHQYDFRMPKPGYIVGGGGHVHGGAYELSLTEPGCGNRELGDSQPTWGNPDHPFYNVKPVLHEPGPVAMSGFQSQDGIPVAAGETLRLNSEYDASRPHTRVMGIMVIYVDHVNESKAPPPCGPMPSDITNQLEPGTIAGRTGEPPEYKIPLTGLDENGNAVTIRKPPGKLRKLKKGETIEVGDRFFEQPNLRVKRGSSVRWDFSGSELHNVTVANGPIGFGSPNLDGDRTFTQRLPRSGNYKVFCALHPVQMTERIVVEGKRRWRKGGK